MNALAFYASCGFYFYNRIFYSHNTEMIQHSFHITVLLGILALLNRR